MRLQHTASRYMRRRQAAAATQQEGRHKAAPCFAVPGCLVLYPSKLYGALPNVAIFLAQCLCCGIPPRCFVYKLLLSAFRFGGCCFAHLAGKPRTADPPEKSHGGIC